MKGTKRGSISEYDIIGDIHGHADALERLLQKLGYTRKFGIYSHAEKRKVVFVGDFIDRGPKIRETFTLSGIWLNLEMPWL